MPNSCLKTSAHSAYDPSFADWDVTSGIARIGTEKTLDAQLPGKIILPSRIYYVAFICAKANAFIVFPSTAYIYAGFWLNNGVSSYWISGTNPFTLTGAVNGSPATTVDRKYKIFARTDRATSFLSIELDFPAAPDDAAFALGATVSLTWDRLQDIGIISYDVYRRTGATYTLLQEVESGANTYTDNNVFEENVAGYPTPTDDRSIALTTTRTNTTISVLDAMFVNGVSAQWSTLAFPIPVPRDYDAGTPAISGDAGLQWLRIGIGGITGAPDMSIPVVTVSGLGLDVEWPDGFFDADQVGLTAVLSDVSNDFSVLIDVFIDNENIKIDTPLANGEYAMYITGGGGAHCILIDCVHCSYGDGATYGANDQDYTPPRPQFPRAAPNGSTQGGTGTGGGPTDGGGPTCVEVNEPALVLYGNDVVQKRIGDLGPGDVVESGNIVPNVVTHAHKTYCPNLWFIETANGCSLKGSPSHPIYRNRLDKAGTPMESLTKRNSVLTNVNGKYQQSRVKKIGPTGKGGHIVKISCSPSPSFVAGNCDSGVGGIVSHNAKQVLNM